MNDLGNDNENNGKTTARAGDKIQAQAEAKARVDGVLIQGAKAVGFRDTDPTDQTIASGAAPEAAVPASTVLEFDHVELGPKSMGRFTIGLVLLGLIVMFMAAPTIHDMLPMLRPGDGDMATTNNIAGAVTAANQPTQAASATPASTRATPTKRGTAQATTTATTPRPTTQPASVTTAAAVVVATAAEACSQTCVAEPSSNACATCGHLVFGWPAPPQ